MVHYWWKMYFFFIPLIMLSNYRKIQIANILCKTFKCVHGKTWEFSQEREGVRYLKWYIKARTENSWARDTLVYWKICYTGSTIRILIPDWRIKPILRPIPNTQLMIHTDTDTHTGIGVGMELILLLVHYQTTFLTPP